MPVEFLSDGQAAAVFVEALTEPTSNIGRQDRATSHLVPNPDHTGIVGYTATDLFLQQLTHHWGQCPGDGGGTRQARGPAGRPPPAGAP